jgi:hypothetical protein
MNNYAIELLKEAGYSMVEIMAMTESQRRNLALEIEAELERIEMES